MRSLLDDFSIVNYKNLVCVLNGRQPMGNGDNRLTPGQLGQSILNQMLIFRVNAGRRLYRDNDFDTI